LGKIGEPCPHAKTNSSGNHAERISEQGSSAHRNRLLGKRKLQSTLERIGQQVRAALRVDAFGVLQGFQEEALPYCRGRHEAIY